MVSVSPVGAQLRAANYGVYVAGSAKAIPGTTFSNIFTITGGRILLTSLIGQVTTVIGGTATTLSIGVTPSGGALAATALCTATAITSAAVGTILALPLLQASALIVSGAGAAGVLQTGLGATTGMGQDISDGGIALVSSGVINISTSATTTGAISWAMTYMPYDPASVVTAN